MTNTFFETYTPEEKEYIAKQIKPISLDVVNKEMNELIKIGKQSYVVSSRSKIGNNVVDYFTFLQRLETKGKYYVNFFEFLSNIETFKEKKFIQNMIKYYKDVKNKNNTKNEYTVYKEIYNICISAINIMRPLNCMDIYTLFKSKRVLNFCAGWGGSMVAAAALNIEAFYGVEINHALKDPYENMQHYLKTKCNTEFHIHIGDACQLDYNAMDYDTVFCSPPYYFKEKYANNVLYKTKQEMEELFYQPVFLKTYAGLKENGHFIINVCKEVYDNVLVPLLGKANVIFPLKKSKRQNEHVELVYVWKKSINTTEPNS